MARDELDDTLETHRKGEQKRRRFADSNREVCADQVSRFGLDAHPVVFPVSLGIAGHRADDRGRQARIPSSSAC